MTSLDELKQKVLATDLSVNNPKVQSIVEEDIGRLVSDYELQEKTRKEVDEYNKQEMVKKRSCPKYIPDEITLGEKKYSPQQMLEHVRARDEEGMYILRAIEDKVMNTPKKVNMAAKGLLESLIFMVTEENADKVAIRCVCGKHKVTYRDMLQGFVDFNPDLSNFADMIYSNAIFSFYADFYKETTPKQPGLLERIKNHLFG